MNDETSSLLKKAAKKAEKKRFFLAEYLTKYRSVRGISEKELAQFLGCTEELLPKLALCRRPDNDSRRFRADVERISSSFHIQPERLAQLIRETDVLKALSNTRLANQEIPHGLLAAARDEHESKQIHKDVPESPNTTGSTGSAT